MADAAARRVTVFPLAQLAGPANAEPGPEPDFRRLPDAEDDAAKTGSTLHVRAV